MAIATLGLKSRLLANLQAEGFVDTGDHAYIGKLATAMEETEIIDKILFDPILELEIMKMNFQSISWAQFSIFDTFEDETKRADPDPSTYDARVLYYRLDNNNDDTADREFGFVSKTYSDITLLDTSTSTDVGLNYLEDTSKEWFTNEVKNLTLIDVDGHRYNIDSNTSNTLTVVGTPVAGSYYLQEDNPSYAVVFCSYLDSTNGGYGYVKVEVSFNGGVYYQTFLDTESSVNRLQATQSITYPGVNYIVRITLKNDASGNSPLVYKYLVCTDPSPWRF